MCKFCTHHATRRNRRKNANQRSKIYNLKAITAVGYRVNSQKAIAFRTWATNILQEYIIKGFAMDELIKTEKVKALKNHKTGLMQQLFLNVNSLAI